MDRIEYMLIETIDNFGREVNYDYRFESMFEDLLVIKDNRFEIKVNIKDLIDQAIKNCDDEITFEQDMYVNGEYEEICIKTLYIYLTFKKSLVKLQNELIKY